MSKFIHFFGVLFCLISQAYASDKEDIFAKASASYNAFDFTTTIKLITPLAENGHAASQELLGIMYFYGEGVEESRENKQKALEYLTKAGEQGLPEAQGFVGEIYYMGYDIVKPDRDKAFKWLSMAAKENDLYSKVYLGMMYYYGQVKDIDRGKKLIEAAANEGIPKAIEQMGFVLYNDEAWETPEPENYEKALYWVTKSAELGNGHSMATLSRMYEKGHGVPKDFIIAAMWGVLTNNTKEKISQYKIQRINEIIESLNPEELEDLKLLVNDCGTKQFENCAEKTSIPRGKPNFDYPVGIKNIICEGEIAGTVDFESKRIAGLEKQIKEASELINLAPPASLDGLMWEEKGFYSWEDNLRWNSSPVDERPDVKATFFDEENSNKEIQISYTFSFLFKDNIIEISSVAESSSGLGRTYNEDGCKLEI